MTLPHSTEKIWIILQALGWKKVRFSDRHTYYEKFTDPYGYKPRIKRVTLIDAWNEETLGD